MMTRWMDVDVGLAGLRCSPNQAHILARAHKEQADVGHESQGLPGLWQLSTVCSDAIRSLQAELSQSFTLPEDEFQMMPMARMSAAICRMRAGLQPTALTSSHARSKVRPDARSEEPRERASKPAASSVARGRTNCAMDVR